MRETASNESSDRLLLDVRPHERDFLAGVLFARGSVSIGRRSAGGHYFPALYVTVSEPHPMLDRVFGEPNVRPYYGHPTYRYGMYDQPTLHAFAERIVPFLPPCKIRDRIWSLHEFTDPSTPAETRNDIAASLRAA